jgi:lysozyme
MKTSQKGIDLIKEFEGYSERVYMCAGGKYTIGYGHTRGVEVGDTCTREQAEKYLREVIMRNNPLRMLTGENSVPRQTMQV